LDALNREEIAKKELENLKEQKDSLETEIAHLTDEASGLQELYAKQDELLKRIFGGEYGSVEENHLKSFWINMKN